MCGCEREIHTSHLQRSICKRRAGTLILQTDARWPFVGLRLTVAESPGTGGALPPGSWSEPEVHGVGQHLDP